MDFDSGIAEGFGESDRLAEEAFVRGHLEIHDDDVEDELEKIAGRLKGCAAVARAAGEQEKAAGIEVAIQVVLERIRQTGRDHEEER